MDSLFPTILLTYFELFRQHFSSSSYVYFKSYVWAMLMLESKKTVTNITHVCFFLDKHIASVERFLSENKWDMNQVTKTLIHILLKALADKLYVYGALLLSIDTTFNAKASRKMIGVQKWKDHSGNPDRGEYIIGHQWAIAGFISRFADRFLCWPVITRIISGKKKPSVYVSTPEGLRPETFWDAVIAIVHQTQDFLDGLAFRVVVDAFFANAVFINPLSALCVHVITRWRKDGVGWDDPAPYSGRGRPRKYGTEYKLANLLKTFTPQLITVYTYGKLVRVVVVTRDIWLRDIQQKVRVVVVEGTHEPIILISTDLTLSAAEIIEIYSSRFSIELAIRDLKQHLGFGDYQCTTTLSIFRFVRLSCISFCLCRLMLLSKLLPKHVSNWLFDIKPEVNGAYAISESELSFARARRVLKRFAIKHILFSNSASVAELGKVPKEYESLFRIAA
jgi:hypothetical protein